MREPETGVTITATIELRFQAYGEIENRLRCGDTETAKGMAEAMVDDIIDCCGISGRDMHVESVECELNE